MNKQGTREDILLALESYGAAGATRDEIVEIIGSSVKAVATSLMWMERDDLVNQAGDRFYLSTIPAPANVPLRGGHETHTNGSGGRVELSDFQRSRAPQSVTIYVSPQSYEDVVGVQFFTEGGQFKLPVFGAIRICVGPETPKWSSEQETNRGIKKIRLIHRDTKTTDIVCNPSYPITIAPE